MKLLRHIVLFFLFTGTASATHIVGGGFNYTLVNFNTYKFQLTLFFDAINGNPGALDTTLTCYIFQKSNDVLMDSLFMPRTESDQYLPYTNPICAQGSGVRTRILLYENTIVLSEQVYSDSAGYYVVWERCCRNAAASNIVLPGATGQTFYMEFPPVVKNGIQFINNSPVFQPITSDYPCVNEVFSLSFDAIDPDGDSLFYSMTVPLKGNSSPDQPINLIAFPAPYEPVEWGIGFNALNAIPGLPPLGVHPKTGLLTCKPILQGLFVFSVKCEEFRDGIKIGEVRREMQLLVKDCILNSPPLVLIPNPATGLGFKKNDTLIIESGTQKACKILKLTDLQKDQILRFRVDTVTANTPSFLRKDTILKFSPGQDSLLVNFCIPACTVSPVNNPWKIAFIVTDNGCSVPKSDTLILNLIARLRPFQSPSINTTGIFEDTIKVVQTEVLTIPIQVSQSQNVPLKITSYLSDGAGNSIPFQVNGIQLPAGNGTGTLNTQFYWPEICFLPEHQPLKLTTIVDATECGFSKSDTLIKWLTIEPKKLNINILSSYSGTNPIVVKERNSINFDLTGTANDNRPLTLSATGSLKPVSGFTFKDVAGNGVVKSDFRFDTDCSTPAGPFEVEFKASSRFCGLEYADSTIYQVAIDFEPDSLGVIPNLITDNGDLKNDGLIMDQILIADNCLYHFDFVEIFNRWGNRVYYSTDRHFAWKPENLEPGMHFFALHFKEKTFRNWLLVLK